VKGFRDFLTRGNLIDLAVAVVIGTAFTAIVTAIVKDLITPLIGRSVQVLHCRAGFSYCGIELTTLQVWARAGAWPSRAQTIMAGQHNARLSPACPVFHRFLVRSWGDPGNPITGS
jgi:large conductance mechanosensitive channel protein